MLPENERDVIGKIVDEDRERMAQGKPPIDYPEPPADRMLTWFEFAHLSACSASVVQSGRWPCGSYWRRRTRRCGRS